VTEPKFDFRKAFRAAYDNAPAEDADRTETEENCGREVIVELPAPWPHKMPVSVKLPLRVVWDGSMGVSLEIGPYDFGEVDVHMLRQAIASYEHHGGRKWPVDWVVKDSPEAADSAAIYPDDDAEGVTNLIDFNAGLPVTPLVARLRENTIEK
jgi:hypothetical protein